MTDTDSHIGWQFDTHYTQLPEPFYTRIDPVPVQNPQLVMLNHALADTLGLTLNNVPDASLAQLFAGNRLPQAASPLAQAYAGHQFGHFSMLGDGRAHLLGEHRTPQGERVDIQLKGSGRPPYARRGDGRAALGPMLREYIISEAMHALGVPTTRSLAVVTTGEIVLRETALPGAVLTRVAASHVRVGTFEYAAQLQDITALQALADYAIARHFPHLAESTEPYADLLETVMDRQITLVTHWLRIGFIHGVMNTDNMAISGETIDYGPCAFMDAYDPATVFSSIDRGGRYAYANQPHIAGWNLARLAEALLPLLHPDQTQAIKQAEEILGQFNSRFQTNWLGMMRCKLGLLSDEPEDAPLIGELLQWMQKNGADYTNTFRALSMGEANEEDPEFAEWHTRWQKRLSGNPKPQHEAYAKMLRTNPAIIPRNHQVEKALRAAENDGDFSVFNALVETLATPYDTPASSAYTTPPKPEERVYQTFCGT